MFVGDEVTTATWMKSSGLADRTFHKAKKWLKDHGHVTKVGHGKWILPEGEERTPDA